MTFKGIIIPQREDVPQKVKPEKKNRLLLFRIILNNNSQNRKMSSFLSDTN
jgi:hypothetical protein